MVFKTQIGTGLTKVVLKPTNKTDTDQCECGRGLGQNCFWDKIGLSDKNGPGIKVVSLLSF